MNTFLGTLGEETFIGYDYLSEDLTDLFLQEYHKQKKEFHPNGEHRGYTMIGSEKLPTILVQEYINFLNTLFVQYAKHYKHIIHSGDNYITASTPFNFQHYLPNKNYSVWHTETFGPEQGKMLRHSVFITYLNELDDGGETEFLYYNIKIKPKKGLTVIWPAGFTHVHRGSPAPKDEKLILTGWYIYKNRIFFHPYNGK